MSSQDRHRLALITSAAVGIITVMMFVNNWLFTPIFLTEARKQTEEMINKHALFPHPGVVSREELMLIMQRLTDISSAQHESHQVLSKQLQRLDDRLRDLEKNK